MLYLICFILFVVMFYSNKMNSSSRCCMFMFIPPQISGVTAYSHHHITSHHKNYSAKSYRLKIDRLCITMSFGHLYWVDEDGQSPGALEMLWPPSICKYVFFSVGSWHMRTIFSHQLSWVSIWLQHLTQIQYLLVHIMTIRFLFFCTLLTHSLIWPFCTR